MVRIREYDVVQELVKSSELATQYSSDRDVIRDTHLRKHVE